MPYVRRILHTAHMSVPCYLCYNICPPHSSLQLELDTESWHVGVYAVVMQHMPPLHQLELVTQDTHVQATSVDTWTALVTRQCHTCHTLRVEKQRWTWVTWGMLAHMAQLTELSVSGSLFPSHITAEEAQGASTVVSAQQQRHDMHDPRMPALMLV